MIAAPASPAAEPLPVDDDNPFAFEQAGPAPASPPVAERRELARADPARVAAPPTPLPPPVAPPPPPQPATTSDNPFAFDAFGGSPVAGPKPDASPEADEPPRSAAKRKSKAIANPPRRTPAGRGERAGGSGKKVVLIVSGLLFVFVVGAGASAAGAYFLFARDTARVTQTTAVTPPPDAPTPDPSAGAAKAETPAPESKAVPEKATPRGKGKGAEKAKSTEKEKRANEPRDAGKTAKAPRGAAGRPFTLPDPPSNPSTVVAAARAKVSLELPAGQVKAVRFGGKDPRVVAVLWSVFGGFQGAGATDAVDVYSLSNGRRVAHLELPADGLTARRAFDLSPDGARIAVEQPAGKLTVIDVESQAKTLDAVDPFAGAPSPRAGPFARFRFAGSPDRVAVVDNAGAVDVWDVAAKARSAGGAPLGAAPAVSDGEGGDFWVFARGTVTEVKAATADAGKTVTVADPDAAPLAVGVDSVGTHGVAVYRGSGPAAGSELAVLDLRQGKLGVTDRVPLPDKVGVPAGAGVVGGGTVAVVHTDGLAGCVLYDSEHKVPVAFLRAVGGPPVRHVVDAESDRLGWVMPDPADGKKSLLVTVDANFDGYQALVDQARSAKKPVYLVPRADGLMK